MNLFDITRSNPRLRGAQVITGSDGNEYNIFICHGCQSCWAQEDVKGRLEEHYPHILSMSPVTKEKTQ